MSKLPKVGPRLKVEVKLVEGSMADIIIVDKRDYWVDGSFVMNRCAYLEFLSYRPPRKRKKKAKLEFPAQATILEKL